MLVKEAMNLQKYANQFVQSLTFSKKSFVWI